MMKDIGGDFESDRPRFFLVVSATENTLPLGRPTGRPADTNDLMVSRRQTDLSQQIKVD